MGALEDIDGKIPGSVMSNALIAQQELSDYLMPKCKEAIKLTEWNQWDIKYLNAECLLKSLLENDGLFDYSMADNMEHIVGLAFAAYDTTASSLSNLVYAMHNHPDETEKVRKAILAHQFLCDQCWDARQGANDIWHICEVGCHVTLCANCWEGVKCEGCGCHYCSYCYDTWQNIDDRKKYEKNCDKYFCARCGCFKKLNENCKLLVLRLVVSDEKVKRCRRQKPSSSC